MCSFSCSSDLDFNQVNDLKLEPVVEANFSHFDVPATAFVASNGSERLWGYDDQDFDVFRDKYFNSYLQRADFYFEINNTINRAFSLSIVLFDSNDNQLTTIKIDVPAYLGSTSMITRTENFQNTRLDLLKRTRKMRFLVELERGSGPALDRNSTGSLVLRSSATVYLKIQ
ncbi:hypothetical protein AAGV28_02145 [Flavobacterium sp. FZUC8N2.13]|uniref:Uncharacterized protein n=1 Tax=Flavobacterium zubiriense TaxID=3138075 RepID=A0ABV4TAZ1_9FLAO